MDGYINTIFSYTIFIDAINISIDFYIRMALSKLVLRYLEGRASVK